jgi:hypothetical protein
MIMKKSLSRAAVMLAVLAALLFCQTAVPTGAAQLVGVETIFDVVPDTAELASLPATGTTFYIQGKIYPFRTVNSATCAFAVTTPRQVGTWRAWGTVADDGKLVMDQSYHINGFGTLDVQGVTGVLHPTGGVTPAIQGNLSGPTTGPTELMALVGGVGFYRAWNGEARIRSYCSDPTRPFRYDRPFCVDFIEGKRR